MSWGVRPQAMLGHSLGEYVAACLAGVFSLEDALRAGGARAARLIADAARRAPCSPSRCPRPRSRPLLGDRALALAAVNGPALCVVAGPERGRGGAARRARGARRRRPAACRTSHAFHSAMMEPVARRLRRAWSRGCALAPPAIPFVSNVTGTWITAAEATDPATGRATCAARSASRRPAHAAAASRPGPAGGRPRPRAHHAGPPARRRRPRAGAPPTLRPAYDPQPDGSSCSAPWRASGSPASTSSGPASTPASGATSSCSLPTPSSASASGSIPGLRWPGRSRRRPSRTRSPPHPRIPVPARHLLVAPRDATEEAIAAVWRQVLALDRVGVHDGFFALGGHSLLAPRILLGVREAFGIDVPLARLLAAPTVAELAEEVERLRRGEAAAEDAPIDLAAEAVLDPAIRVESPPVGNVPDPRPWPSPAPPVSLAPTCCATCCGHPRRRPLPGARREPGGGEGPHPRTSPPTASIREPRWTASSPCWATCLAALGHFGGGFRALAERAEAVYHCGAWVNFTYPYRRSRPPTSAPRRRPCGSPPWAGPSRCTSSPPSPSSNRRTGDGAGPGGHAARRRHRRARGRLPAEQVGGEQLVALARGRGIAASVHRPGPIAGDAARGRQHPRPRLDLLKGCIQMGTAPDLAVPFDPVPVDYLAAGIVHLLRRTRASAGPSTTSIPPTSWRDVFLQRMRLGYPVQPPPPPSLAPGAPAAVESGAENALAPFWPLLRGMAAPSESPLAEVQRPSGPRFDDRNTESGLAGSGIVCPPADRALFDVYFAHFVESGFLPPPPVLESVGG